MHKGCCTPKGPEAQVVAHRRKHSARQLGGGHFTEATRFAMMGAAPDTEITVTGRSWSNLAVPTRRAPSFQWRAYRAGLTGGHDQCRAGDDCVLSPCVPMPPDFLVSNEAGQGLGQSLSEPGNPRNGVRNGRNRRNSVPEIAGDFLQGCRTGTSREYADLVLSSTR